MKIIKKMCTEFKIKDFQCIFFMFMFILFPIFLDIYTKRQFGFISYGWAFITATSLIFPLLLFPKFTKIYCVVIAIFIYIPYGIRILNFFTFNTLFDKGAMFAILDTNFNEFKDFFKEYINWKNVITLILLLFSIFFSILKIESFEKIKQKTNIYIYIQQLFFIVFLIAISRGVYSAKISNKWRLPIYDIRNYYKEFKAHSELKEINNLRKFSKFENISSVFGEQKQTFVVIFGEASSRHHYSLYGYKRNTNPNLKKIKNELFIFNNIVSSHPQTYTSFIKLLSFADFNDMNAMFNKGTIINFFKDAGFKTFWFSNQESSSRFISTVASESDSFVFDYSEDDIDLLKKFDEALKEKAKKKIIFLHFRGEHAPYEKNYPSNFNIWNVGDTRVERKINAYDNSILYRDFVISKFINNLAKIGGISYLVYLPDHAEDVKDKKSCFCHNSSLAKDIMFEIPFIVWLSPKYKEIRSDFINSFNFDLKFNTQHFNYAIMDLSGLYNDDIDTTKSLFSETYKEPNKLIIK